MTFHRPHVLLFDETTNHLDMGTIESLVESLWEFEGVLVVISHEISFLKQVIEGDGVVEMIMVAVVWMMY